jgi:hypothetical protein
MQGDFGVVWACTCGQDVWAVNEATRGERDRDSVIAMDFAAVGPPSMIGEDASLEQSFLYAHRCAPCGRAESCSCQLSGTRQDFLLLHLPHVTHE